MQTLENIPSKSHNILHFSSMENLIFFQQIPDAIFQKKYKNLGKILVLFVKQNTCYLLKYLFSVGITRMKRSKRKGLLCYLCCRGRSDITVIIKVTYTRIWLHKSALKSYPPMYHFSLYHPPFNHHIVLLLLFCFCHAT